MKRTGVVVVASVAALIVLAGCGGSSKPNTNESKPSTTSPSAATTTSVSSTLQNSNGPLANGCAVSPPPNGAASTSIQSWTDPRPCAWKSSYPLFAPPAPGDGSLSQVQAKDQITVCAETDVRPIVYQDPKTGKIEGFEVDILRKAANLLHIQSVKYVNIPFASYIPALQAHKCDILMGGLSITSKRAQAPGIRYTFPYFRYADVVIVKADSPYHSVDDLKGKSFASVPGSVEDTETKDIVKRLGHGTSVHEYDQISSTYLAVLTNKDAALIDLAATYKLHPSGNKLRTLPGLVTPALDPASPYFPASGAILTSSKANDLNIGLSVALGVLNQNGTLESILKKWDLYQQGVTKFIHK